MFPTEIQRSITLYIPRFEESTHQWESLPVILQGVHIVPSAWESNTPAAREAYTRTGRQIREETMVFIPFEKAQTGREYLPNHHWVKLQSKEECARYWTVNLAQSPIVIPEECRETFPKAALGEMRRYENTLLQQNPAAMRVVAFAPRLYGTKDMWHFVLRAQR